MKDGVLVWRWSACVGVLVWECLCGSACVEVLVWRCVVCKKDGGLGGFK